MTAIALRNRKYSAFLLSLAVVLLAFPLSAESTALVIRTKVGNPCQGDLDCGGDLSCVTEKESRRGAKFAGGYCVKFDCSLANPCDIGSVCANPEGAKFNLCLAKCQNDAHCRNGYSCQDSGVCLPS